MHSAGCLGEKLAYVVLDKASVYESGKCTFKFVVGINFHFFFCRRTLSVVDLVIDSSLIES